MTGVLIVDDDPKVRRSLRTILEAIPHTVLEAGNGREAMPLVEQHEPDLLIVDIVMPEMDGLETIRAVRGKGYRMPIIAMPLRADAAQKRYSDFARSFGADDVLPKPFVETDVLLAVRRSLDDKGERGAGGARGASGSSATG
ncbi:MAG: response regulator [Kiloniellales bacterium]|nr:response regulator [Kiloniellales bacterium]